MAGFDGTGFDNTGYYTGAGVTPPAVVITDHGAGSGGHKEPALIAPFIRWGKKKKDKQAQIAEVADAIQQTVAKADAPYIDPVERDLIAARMLETETLASMRRIRTIDDMLARIEREIMEMDDEEAILLLM